MALITSQILLLYIFSFNLSYAVPSDNVLKNIPVNGTISSTGCNIVKGIIMNEQINLLKTNVCHYDNYKFLITDNLHRGCVEMLSLWTDPESNKSFTFGAPCDVPNFAIGKVIELGYYFSPLKQIKLGVPFNQVTCSDYSLQLMTNPYSQTAICVKPSTAQKLVERGWGSTVQLPISLPTTEKNYGTLSGNVTTFDGMPCIYPCLDRHSYVSANFEVDVYTSDGVTLVGKTFSNANGTYSIQLPAGNYKIYYNGNFVHKSISILANQTTIFNIAYAYAS